MGDCRSDGLRQPHCRRASVRLSGQDSGRGTFSQRHAVWVDQNSGEKYIPLTKVEGGRFEVRDSPLSEFGVLGFEYGYSLADPKTLVLWEAQFGDFANGAQPIIDQFIAAGEAKWLRASGLVMLLPHGFEGQGPEHSSARLERYLQLCAEDNMQVAYCTTPANYFHILRRQMRRDFRKPLIMMTPKSLLRHKLAVSKLTDFTGESHFRRILSDLNPPAEGEARRLVLCSGKLAYELMETRDAGRGSWRGDRARRATVPVPVRAARQAPKGNARAEGRGLGAGGAEEQWRLVLRRDRTSSNAWSTRASGHSTAICGSRRERFSRDRARQTPRSRAGGLDRRRSRPSSQPRSRCCGAIKGNHGH